MTRTLIFFLALIGLTFAQPATQTASTGRVVISGDLSTPVTLTGEDLAKMPRQTVTVPDQDGTKVSYEGVALREVLSRAGAPFGKQLRGKALASYVIATARDGYQVVFTLAELDPDFANESILIAEKRNGKALFEYQGPLRLICSNDKAGARSVRRLEKLEFIRLAK